tara:strand:- start:402 stop:548 length:147 start_codon:yes stop_codon:yes gene_type:complete
MSTEKQHMNKEKCREQIQEDLMTFLDGMDQKILDQVCQIVVDNFRNLT